ncbi:MAG: hypothetical protein ACWGNV_01475 [Bacteroidales bacterium]
MIFSCNQKPPEGPEEIPEADIALDSLVDKMDYEEGMIVDARYFRETATERIVLNGTAFDQPVTLDLREAGYYRIEIYTGSKTDPQPQVIRVVVLDPERGNPDWGLRPWTPSGVETEVIGNQEVQLVYPRNVPAGAVYPVVAVVEGELTGSLVNLEAGVGERTFLIKRGTGSIWISGGDQPAATMVIDHRSFPIEPSLMDGAYIELNGTLEEPTEIPQESYVRVTGNLTIPAGIALTIGPGTYLSIDPEVDINLEGSLLSQGTSAAPVVFTCSDPENYWGGVIGKGTGNQVEATHTLFGRSGFHAGGDYGWGHAHRQALFYSEYGSVLLDHCYMIDHIGQIFYTQSSVVEIVHCLIQRAKTGGQINHSQLTVDHAVFTDFPDESDQYRDEDNDALYLVDCVAHISNSFFLYAKDDGIDSGTGSYGGDVTVTRCRFESMFHEGAALSGGTSSSDKIQRFYHCYFRDCGQGLELGFSAANHSVLVDSCTLEQNGIGIRYGDNYDFGNYGTLYVSNSESLDNVSYDVWNMDRKDWEADTSSMVFDNVWVSKPNPMYPELHIIGE